MAHNGTVSPSKLSFPESGDRIIINVGFIKGALSEFYYYRINVIVTEETASKYSATERTLTSFVHCHIGYLN